MVYSTEASKWRAYQFSDPFAAGSYVVCNKITTQFCRPDCDAHPITELRAEIKFADCAADAVKLGYSPCESCNPLVVPSINVNLLLKTVKEINALIGFVQPLLDDDEDKVHESIKENIMGHGQDQRRMSLPANSFAKKNVSYSVSKNDSEHYRLIDLACRHLALAAANSIFSASPASSPGSPKDEKKKGGRKRRGGVLGFKELATKSKLSAWHFHRVFKSIIGLTPKTYGDMCWEYLEKERDSMTSPFIKPASGPEPDVGSLATQMKSPKKRSIDADEPAAKRPALNSFDDFRLEEKDFALNLRATSVPNLTSIYEAGPRSLFPVQYPEFETYRDIKPEPYMNMNMNSENMNSENLNLNSENLNLNDSFQNDFQNDASNMNLNDNNMNMNLNMGHTDFLLPSFGLEEDFSNISPESMTNETTPQGLGFDDPMSMFFTPQDSLPLDYQEPDFSVLDSKKTFELAADPMMAGINDMLVASGY